MPRVQQPQRRERLSLNLFDLDRVDPTVRQLLLAGNVDLTRAIRVDRNRMDEAAVLLTCDLLTAACIADTLREHDRRARACPCRTYLRRVVAWERLPAEARLATVRDGKPVLNPELFPPPTAAAPLPPRRLNLGRS